jgi:hypothetical protein
MPDYTAAIASAKLLLELVVSRPKQPDIEQPVWGEGEEGREQGQPLLDTP